MPKETSTTVKKITAAIAMAAADWTMDNNHILCNNTPIACITGTALDTCFLRNLVEGMNSTTGKLLAHTPTTKRSWVHMADGVAYTRSTPDEVIALKYVDTTGWDNDSAIFMCEALDHLVNFLCHLTPINE